MTLAEVIEEGERLEAVRNSVIDYHIQWIAWRNCSRFYVANGPRLLAVAKAAVEWRRDTRDDADARLAAVVDAAANDAGEETK